MLTERLPPNCPPVSEWSTNPGENARIAPGIDARLHSHMAAVARMRDDMSGLMRSSGAEPNGYGPGCYCLITKQAIDGNDLPDGCVLGFTAHADSALFQAVSVNGGPPFPLYTDKLEMGPRWLRKGGSYTIVFEAPRRIWVIRPAHEVVLPGGVAP